MSVKERVKLISTFSMKVTDNLSEGYKKLDPMQKFRLQERMRYEMARAIHESKFDPKKYLE